ncbi:MAG: InlB B-repeat-containing protein, partial [Roseburia sp.]|nr:InlB B-repeat-containing protein [Roseburia sp.]MCM1099494.1 InlB B-repeat-containing protein [Ruminococcus flavefaciens]
INPSFTLTQAALSGWAARGWSTGTAGNSGITYSNGVAFTRDSNVTLYGMYYQTITLYYNGNGNTGGSTANQTGTRYYNSNGNVTNPSFTLSANGFAKTGYTFSAWALNGGTQYSAGASVTLAASATMYAVWTYVGAPFYIVDKYTCQDNYANAITWSMVSGSNVSKVRTWTAGMYGSTVYGTSTGGNCGFKAKSSAINTNGNRTLSISAGSSNEGGQITVNGITQTPSQLTTNTWDISGLTTFNIEFYAGAWELSGDPYMQFGKIYLS